MQALTPEETIRHWLIKSKVFKDNHTTLFRVV